MKNPALTEGDVALIFRVVGVPIYKRGAKNVSAETHTVQQVSNTFAVRRCFFVRTVLVTFPPCCLDGKW